MPRSSSVRAALAGLLTAGLACLGATPPASAAPADEVDPLLVHIDTIDPVLPRNGDVHITGTVTNVSPDTYTRINLHAFSSENPILDSASLVASAASDPDQAVGERVTVPGTFYTVDELAPGQTAYFSDTVPVDLLSMDPTVQGVYWIGVHALGDGAVPRDSIADGRARTFIPAEPSGSGSSEAAVILSIRSRVWFTDEGTVGGLDRWARRLAEGGSLDSVLDMAESADGTPYSWLVDPAVLNMLRRLQLGNPGRDIAPDTTAPDQEASPTGTPSAQDGDGPSQTPTVDATTPPPNGSAPEPTAEEQALASAATAWLDRFRALVGSQPVLTLPFGDLDVSAAVRNDRGRLDEAVARSAELMAALDLPTRPAVSPVDDLISPEALQAVAQDTVVLLGDSAFDLPPTTPHSVVRMLGHKVVVTSTAAESGGPGPTAANDPLALRQRLVSEAALRVLDDDTAPLVMTLPAAWHGTDAAAFFDGLEQPWLDVVPVEQIADDRSAVGLPSSKLNYTGQEDELPARSFAAATTATDAAALLEQVLYFRTTIEAQVADETLVTLSEQHRERPRLALRAAGRVEDAMRGYLGKVQVEAPSAVTLFSASGKLGATLVNNLDQPVTVLVRPRTDGELTLSDVGERVLGPSARTVLRYEATTDQLGVHKVLLEVTSLDGTPIGSSAELPIRAARVSILVWVAMAGGALLLFGMIGYRLPGQIRARRAARAAEARGEDPDGAAGAETNAQAEAAGAADGDTPTDVRRGPTVHPA